MKRPTTLRPLPNEQAVDLSRENGNDTPSLLDALDAASFVLLHGDRPQQIAAANAARELLRVKGYPVRTTHPMRFTVTARVPSMPGAYTWDAIGNNSADVMLDALNQYGGQFVSISVRQEASE